MAVTDPQTPDTTSSPSDSEPSSASIARGSETRKALLQKLRPPPLVHSWNFWLEKKASILINSQSSNPERAYGTTPISTPHNTTLTQLHTITDVKNFWNLFNNFSFSTLPPSISVHLFHSTVRPLWEDKRNVSGGAWVFRLPRQSASPFFRALALLAVGERLQEAITDEDKVVFRDDICGISFTVKSEKTVVASIWNRDAGNEVGKAKLLDVVLRTMPVQIKPAEESYYYKKHADHIGFAAEEKGSGKPDETKQRSEEVSKSVRAVELEYEKVRRILEEVKLKDAEMEEELDAEITRNEVTVESGLQA